MTPVWAQNLVSDGLWSDKAACGLCSPYLLFDTVSSSPVVVWILICIHLCSTFSPLLLHVLSTKVVVMWGQLQPIQLAWHRLVFMRRVQLLCDGNKKMPLILLEQWFPIVHHGSQGISNQFPLDLWILISVMATLKFSYFLIKGLMCCYK